MRVGCSRVDKNAEKKICLVRVTDDINMLLKLQRTVSESFERRLPSPSLQRRRVWKRIIVVLSSVLQCPLLLCTKLCS